jgi:hypothetical protein
VESSISFHQTVLNWRTTNLDRVRHRTSTFDLIILASSIGYVTCLAAHTIVHRSVRGQACTDSNTHPHGQKRTPQCTSLPSHVRTYICRSSPAGRSFRNHQPPYVTPTLVSIVPRDERLSWKGLLGAAPTGKARCAIEMAPPSSLQKSLHKWGLKFE